MRTINDLLGNFDQPGYVFKICVRPERLAAIVVVDTVMAIASQGLKGDRYHGSGARQVTLIANEDLIAISAFMNREIPAELARRNIVTAGINLLSLKGRTFKIGEALFEFSGECHPCSRMEQNIGFGGYNAMLAAAELLLEF
jgi:MOSC domain-containing protein YiiM